MLGLKEVEEIVVTGGISWSLHAISGVELVATSTAMEWF